jgi:hypothetical protein
MKLPKGWKDISIGQFIDLLPSNYKDKNEVEQLIHTLKTVSNSSIEEVRKLSIKDAKEYASKLTFLNELPSGKPLMKFKLKGVTYKVEPDAQKCSAGTYITTMHIFQDMDKDPDLVNKNLHIILAQIIKPTYFNWRKFKREYKEVDIMELSKVLYEELPVSIAYPIIVFFCNLSKLLIPVISDYSTKKIEEVKKELSLIEKDLKGGDGS